MERLRIALCDDNMFFLESFKSKLEAELSALQTEALITIFHSGRLFLDQLSEYDAAFLDIDMPGFDGLRVAESVNRINPIPIIFLTAFEELVYYSIRFRPFRFIRKTHIKEELGEAVRALMVYFQSGERNEVVRFRTNHGEMECFS